MFVELHGELGAVGQSRLETAANNFERGQVDNFVVKGTNVGDVQKVVIWHDNSGLGGDWHLQQVRRRAERSGAGGSGREWQHVARLAAGCWAGM